MTPKHLEILRRMAKDRAATDDYGPMAQAIASEERDALEEAIRFIEERKDRKWIKMEFVETEFIGHKFRSIQPYLDAAKEQRDSADQKKNHAGYQRSEPEDSPILRKLERDRIMSAVHQLGRELEAERITYTTHAAMMAKLNDMLAEPEAPDEPTVIDG